MTAEREDLIVVRVIKRLEAVEDVGRLPQRQPEIAPVERDVTELNGGVSGPLLRLEPAGREVNPREGDARLDAAQDFDELQLHVNRGGQFGMGRLDPSELDDVAGFGALWTRGSVGSLAHAGIVSWARAPGLVHGSGW